MKRRPKRLYLLWLGGLGVLALFALGLAFALRGISRVDAAPNFSFTLGQGEEELSTRIQEQADLRGKPVTFRLVQGNEVGGRLFELADLRGKPVVLNFWAGLCAPCRAEMPDLQLFYEDYKDRVTIVGIDLGEYTGLGTQGDAQDLVDQIGVTYPIGFTSDATVVERYKILYMPTTLFINSRGEVLTKWEGRLTRDLLKDVTNDMLARESR
ncbi:MAG: TlpA family protein disulfide reductase [Chloroflexi bacterium]|nr:TlpA family protein disulfide reductase [Chloroflexota bacterium]